MSTRYVAAGIMLYFWGASSLLEWQLYGHWWGMILAVMWVATCAVIYKQTSPRRKRH